MTYLVTFSLSVMKEYCKILWYIVWNEQIVSTHEYTRMFTSIAGGLYFTMV